MLVPSRHSDTKDYRYGFQGQEKDDEIKGEGNSLNYEFRMYDTRVGRFFAIDPLTSKYPWYTPYSFSGNKVIQYVELEGMEESPSGSNSTTIDGSIAQSYQLQSVTILTQKKHTFWQKAGAFGKGFVTALVVTVAVVVVIAAIAATGPVAAIIATVASDALLVAGGVYMTNSAYTVATGEDFMSGNKVGELERYEEAGSLTMGIVGLGVGSKLGKTSQTGSPELATDNFAPFEGNKLSTAEMQNTVGTGPSSKKAFNIDIANASDSELGALNHAFNRHASELSVLIDKPIRWAKKDNLASMMDNFNEAVNLIETQGTKVGKTRVPYGEKGSGVNAQSTEADVYIYQHTNGKEYYSYRRSSDNQFISAGEKTRNINTSN